MSFDAALNAVWLLLGAIALACTAHARLRNQARHHTTGAASLHIIGVALIVAALFPYISATDDVVRIQHFDQQHDRRHPARNTQNENLIRLYETMDTPLVCHVQAIALVLFFVALVVAPVVKRICRNAPAESGRSPPLSLAA